MDAPDAAELSYDEPSWLYPGSSDLRVSPGEAADFLLQLSAEDFGVFALAYGLGMRFGAVSRTLKLDPALVAWRLRRALERWRRGHTDSEASARALENSLVDLLREPTESELPQPPAGLESWRVGDLLVHLEAEVRNRLATQLGESRKADPVRPGVGMGLAALVLIAAATFTVFGVLLDDHPMRRGRMLLLEERYAEARASFMRLGTSTQGRKYRALCYVAEGRFEDAFELFGDIEVLGSLGQFAPRERPLPPLGELGAGAALLPRGQILSGRPSFVLSTPNTGELRVTVSKASRSFPVTDEEGLPRRVIELPEDWGNLPSEPLRWSLVDTPGSWADFEILPEDQREDIRKHLKAHMPRELRGTPAAVFLRAQLYLNQHLLVDAGENLAELVKTFPEAEYPARRLEEVATALGVDPSAFLR